MVKCWFDYKTVIVSGASSGIGKGLVEKLIKEHGCNVIGIARNKKKIQAVVEDLGELSYKFSYYLFDVSVQENWENFTKELVEKKIKPDMLINNAGILPRFDKFTHYSLDDINVAMQINFYSCVYSMRCLLPIILHSPDAAIVNIASSAALCSLAGTSIYSASKAALKSLTEAIREENRGNCYVGLICPGFTKTDIFANQKESSSKSEKAMNMISTSCDKMVCKIINGIWKKKPEMVFGMDAHFMGDGTKLFGTQVSKVSSKVMKISGLEIFEDVFSI